MQPLFLSRFPSPVGPLVLLGGKNGIAGLWMEGQKYFGSTLPENFVEDCNHPILLAGRKWLDDYFAEKRPLISRLSLSPGGSEFRRIVWRLLTEIPYGKTVTYGALAKQTARQFGRLAMSAQAVGGAVGHNPISIIIPCHRVIGAHGNLTGYAGGLDIKVKLLRHEGVDFSSIQLPEKETALQ